MLLSIIVLLISNAFSCDLQEVTSVKKAKECLHNRNGALKELESQTLKEKNEIQKKITKREIEVIYNYVQGDSTLLNKALWSDQLEKDPKLVSKRNRLDKVLNKLASEEILLHRGLTLPIENVALYKKDQNVLWKGYTSTSLKSSLFFVGNFRFFIIAKNGKKIWPVSPQPEEWEYLILPKTSFKVIDVEKNYYKEKKGNVHEILLKEI